MQYVSIRKAKSEVLDAKIHRGAISPLLCEKITYLSCHPNKLNPRKVMIPSTSPPPPYTPSPFQRFSDKTPFTIYSDEFNTKRQTSPKSDEVSGFVNLPDKQIFRKKTRAHPDVQPLAVGNRKKGKKKKKSIPPTTISKFNTTKLSKRITI